MSTESDTTEQPTRKNTTDPVDPTTNTDQTGEAEPSSRQEATSDRVLTLLRRIHERLLPKRSQHTATLVTRLIFHLFIMFISIGTTNWILNLTTIPTFIQPPAIITTLLYTIQWLAFITAIAAINLEILHVVLHDDIQRIKTWLNSTTHGDPHDKTTTDEYSTYWILGSRELRCLSHLLGETTVIALLAALLLLVLSGMHYLHAPGTAENVVGIFMWATLTITILRLFFGTLLIIIRKPLKRLYTFIRHSHP